MLVYASLRHLRCWRYAISILALAGAASAATIGNFQVIDYPGALDTQTFGINNSGQISGTYVSGPNLKASVDDGFILTNGVFTTISAPGAADTEVYGISNTGTVVGAYNNPATGPNVGFSYDGQTFSPISYPGATGTVPQGINDAGQIVGFYYQPQSAFSLKGSVYTSLSSLASSSCGYAEVAFGINNSGTIVGGCSMLNGFILSGTSFSTFAFPGAFSTTALGIGSDGTVVGAYQLVESAQNNSHGFVYRGGQFQTIDVPGAEATYVSGMNDQNDLVGYFFDSSGVEHGFMLPGGFVITGLNPSSATASGAAFTLTVNGNGFPAGSNVLWNSTTLATSFVSATQLTASVPASLIASAGNASIAVMNPGGMTSNAVTFLINLAPQTITFGPLPNATTAAAPFSLAATASSGLTVAFASSTPAVCTTAGATATIVAAGVCSIAASQSGNATFAAATTVTQSFRVFSGPATISLSPTSGSGTSVTFQTVYEDSSGAADLTELLLQVNASQSSANACYVYYQPQGNHLYLANNAGNAWITPALTPGTAGTASNSQCTLNAGSSSVSAAGDTLTPSVALTFSDTFLGAKNVYLYAAGLSGTSSGWVMEGTWTPNPGGGLPAVVSLSPSEGGGPVTFQAVYSDPNGVGDLSAVLLQMNTTQASAHACYVYYQPQTNDLYLANDAGAAWVTPALTPGVAGTVSNSQCTLNGASSSVTTMGNNLTLNVALTFSGTFLGAENVYLYAAGLHGQDSGWVKEGTWTLPNTSAGPPAIVSLSPSEGVGQSVSFQAIYSDPNGNGDLNVVLLQVNSVQSSANACYVYYHPQQNLLYLYNDGAWMTPGLTPGAAGTATNSQCTLNAGTSSVMRPGSDALIVNVALSFSDTFVGQKNVYLYAGGIRGQNSGWVVQGSWMP